LAVALILGNAGRVACQTASKPIPDQWLRDGHLVVPEFNFSVDSPNPESRWSYRELPDIQGFKTTAFVVDASHDENYSVIVWESGSSGRMDDPASKKRFVDHMQKALPKDWQAADNPHIELTAVPMSGSWKVKTTIRRPADDSLLYSYLYVVTGKRTYMFITYSREETEPLQFSRFVASFALLSPSANALTTASPENSTSGLLMILAIVGAVIDWRYKRRGGVKPTKKDRLYFLAAVLLCGMTVGGLGIGGASAEALGSLTGFLTVLLFALWELGRWGIRRKYPVPITDLAADMKRAHVRTPRV